MNKIVNNLKFIYIYTHNKMNYINDLFLFVLSIDINIIINELDLLELDKRYLVSKDKKKNKNKIIIQMMRYNFGKFWNIISPNDKHKFIKIFITESNINIIDIEYDNVFSLIYNTLDKIIKYSDNVNLIEHTINFYDFDLTVATFFIEHKNIDGDVNEQTINNFNNYNSKNEIINFRHNICMFWLGLTNQRKTKLINMAETFFSKLNPTQLKIIFEKRTPYINYTINYFDSYQNNVILIKNYEQLTNMVEKIVESIIIDTIIFQDINLSEYCLTDIPSQIKKIKFKNSEIKSIDQIHEGIEVIDCDGNYIKNIDNLPTSIKVLICSNNELSSLNNLPEGLEYLDCHTNKITKLVNLPKSLKYLHCNYNRIESINYLPSNLIKLDCSKNLLHKLPKLPDNLVKLNIKGNKFTNLEVIPFGLRELNISGNQINKINSLNAGLETIIIDDSNYYKTDIFDLPNMLISSVDVKFNY